MAGEIVVLIEARSTAEKSDVEGRHIGGKMVGNIGNIGSSFQLYGPLVLSCNLCVDEIFLRRETPRVLKLKRLLAITRSLAVGNKYDGFAMYHREFIYHLQWLHKNGTVSSLQSPIQVLIKLGNCKRYLL